MTSIHVMPKLMVLVMLLVQISGKADDSSSLSEADIARIDAYIERQLKEANIPGASLAIVEEDRIIHARGFGVAGPDGRPVSAETPFFIGSMTKSFTALAIMQLVEAGHVELDAPVQTYLPWFRVSDPEASRQMKVRHLLNHTSGFSTYEGRTHFSQRDMSPEAIERRVRALRNAKLTAPVGEKFQYSNANYIILGEIIETTSGQGYEDYIQDHIFDPLNMTHSYTSERMAQRHGLASGYRYWFGKAVAATDLPHSRCDLPASYLTSCASDMGKYLLAHMNAGRVGDARVLSASGISKLHTGTEPFSYYAMGWGIGAINGIRILRHNGITPGSYSEMAIFPERQLGLVLLINAQNFLSGPDVASLGQRVTWQALGISAPPISKAPRVHPQLAMLCVLLVAQVTRLAAAGRRFRRWRKHPGVRARKEAQLILMRRGLSAAVDLGIVVGLLWFVPRLHDIPFSGILLYAPDAGWLLLLNGGISVFLLALSLATAGLMIHQSRREMRARERVVETSGRAARRLTEPMSRG